MANFPPIGIQLFPITPFIQESFNLRQLEVSLSAGLGCDFKHYAAMPSPIGKNDRGDLRRSEGVDTITSNGMLYTCMGTFTATLTDNVREQKAGTSGPLDPSEGRLVMPRFYNANGGFANGDVIYLAPGDRLYFGDPQADCRVANYQFMDYIPGVDNVPMFPIICLQAPLVDSRNITYNIGLDYEVTAEGNIRWLPGGSNPGIDPSTGKGRIYSIRYLYKAFYYVTALIKEVRITNVTFNGVRSAQRMPMFAAVMREYMFHNQNNGSPTNQNVSPTPQRVVAAPIEPVNPNSTIIPVDMSNFIKGGDSGE
jgi:hypothetical protein